jgi:hypothetical protein
MSDTADTTLPVEFLGTLTADLGGETPVVPGPGGTVDGGVDYQIYALK